MYDFHYNYIKQKYGDKTKLLFADTDSLMYEIQTEDFYMDIGADCYVHTQLFLALYMCVFMLNGFPLWLLLEPDSLLWNFVLEVSGPF